MTNQDEKLNQAAGEAWEKHTDRLSGSHAGPYDGSVLDFTCGFKAGAKWKGEQDRLELEAAKLMTTKMFEKESIKLLQEEISRLEREVEELRKNKDGWQEKASFLYQQGEKEKQRAKGLVLSLRDMCTLVRDQRYCLIPFDNHGLWGKIKQAEQALNNYSEGGKR